MSGDNRQQWGYSHYNQTGHEPGQGNFVNSSFGPASNDINPNPYSVSQQWQPQDHQFMQGNGYPSYQSQGQGYPVQNFPGGNAHVQSHQHPQTYSTPISVDGQQDVSWDYDFGFDTNPLAGIGESMPFGSGLTHAPQPNGLPSSYPQDMSSTVAPQQHQFLAEPSPGHFYAPNQVPQNSRSPQQQPPQPMVQQVAQRQAMEYQQPNLNQQQQQQQPAPSQNQQPNILQASNQQPNQPQNMNIHQQPPRLGTPQSTSSTPQPRQSPFSSHQVQPLSIQQAQFASQNGRGSPAMPFTAHQQISVPKPQPNLSNGPTTQSRFMPPQTVSAQRPMIPSPVAVPNNTALPNLKSKVQQSIQQYVQPELKPNTQPKAAVPVSTPPVYQQASAGGLAPPRVIRRDDNAIPSARSRYVGFTLTPSSDLEGGLDEERPIGDIKDPSEIDDKQFGRYFPGPNGQLRPLASSIVQDWSRAMESDDSTGQNEQEQRLKQYLGGEIPKHYEDILKETKAAKEKASRKPGPKRSKTRPADEADAAEWDAIGVVYLPSSQPTGVEIGAAVAAYGKLIRGLTADFQATKQKLKSAKETDAAAMKEKVARRLEIISRAVEGANTWGDRQVLANLGGNQKLISDFVTCLIHANNSADHNGKAAKGVLRLMSEVTTVEKEFLMMNLQFAKISKKFESKGDAEVKEMVKKIKENVVSREEVSKNGLLDISDAASAPEAASSVKSASTSGSTTSKVIGSSDAAKKKAVTTAVTKAPTTLSAVKRPRDEEFDTKSVKRLAAEPPTAQAAQPIQKLTSSKVVVPAPNAATTAQSKLFLGSGMLGAKVKPISKAVTKGVPVKSDSTTKPEAKKEPGTAKLDPSRARKIEPLKDDASSTSKLGGIGALLEEISKPKPAGRATPEKESKVKKDETPDEKARRLRKEKRRHLRVSWKEGDDLTDVRIFHKDIAEDEGRASNMIRDARDDRSEGMVLRQGLKGGTQLDDEDEEDELPYRPWFEPPSIDFAFLPQDQRDKNFITRGGLVEFETEQQKFIAERENKELMVVYTDPSDIPPTPKSPHTQPQEDTEMQSGTVNSLPQDGPQLAEIHLRWTEAESRGSSWARLNALRRAQKAQAPPSGIASHPNMQSTPPSTFSQTASIAQERTMSKEDQVLTLLTSSQIKNWTDPDPYDPTNLKTHRRYDYIDPELQRAASLIEDVAEKLKGKTAPPSEPPEWMKHDSARVAEWWHGYNKDKQRTESKAQQEQAMQAAHPTPAAQPQVTPQAASAAQGSVDPNAAAWAAYYAQLQQYQAQAQPQAASQDPYEQYNAYQQASQAPQQQAAPVQAAGDSNAQLQAVLAALGAAPTQAPQQQPAQNSDDPQLQALLASLAGGPAAQPPAQAYQQQQAQYATPNPADPNYMAYIMSLASGQPQQAQQTISNGSHREDERDRDRDSEEGHSSRREKGRGGKHTNNVPRGINPNKIGTKPCTFWAKGMCNKGEQCTFRHD
ncbi:hypothetical protein VM1G_09810 [Cytospora mali]|uniref:C3H1-type domain-containing protein n=1 Tax=Cytospora mali TaxID=578113 RepID=A0A194WE03_CYTMA|nr:hypothetical protein VM1G_09810 [Valsa mali]